MVKKFYHAFGEVDLALDAFLDVLNPTGADIAALQVRPYDGGVAPLLSTYGAVDALCDLTWALRDAKTVLSPLKATPDTVSIIRTTQLQTILDAVNYVGNRIYVVCLNDHPLIYSDYARYAALTNAQGIRDDISGDNFNKTAEEVYHRMFIPYCEETFDPANMSGIFIQSQITYLYTATVVRDWVALGNVFVNMLGAYKLYNGGGETMLYRTAAIGDLLRIKKDDTCLRPLDGGVPTEYTLTRAMNERWYYWDTLPTQAGWTTNTLMSLVVNATEYPCIIEMVHDASGGTLISWGLRSGYLSQSIPAWWYPIFAYQYALGKAGYLGVVPAYNTE